MLGSGLDPDLGADDTLIDALDNTYAQKAGTKGTAGCYGRMSRPAWDLTRSPVVLWSARGPTRAPLVLHGGRRQCLEQGVVTCGTLVVGQADAYDRHAHHCEGQPRALREPTRRSRPITPSGC